MEDLDSDISCFGGTDMPTNFNIDLTQATRLERRGSTCDAYEYRLNRRHIFIKRLKPEFQNSPLHLAALDKEYEIGVSLNHHSLPHYIDHHAHYIITDYIEGDTLADLIRRGDRRLTNVEFKRKIMLQLIDAVEYLHTRNVVHCDIKPDNIIISPYRDRPLTLIDLDKAYTSWFDSTPGNPAKYGCDNCNDGEVDIRGIGKIAGQLGLTGLRKAAQAKGATTEQLRSIITRRKGRWIWPTITTTLTIAMMIWLTINTWKTGDNDNSPDTAYMEAPTGTPATATNQAMPDSESVIPQPTIAATPAKPTKTGIDTAWVSSVIARHYGPLSEMQHEAETYLADSTATADDLRRVAAIYSEAQGKAQSKIYTAIARQYPQTDPAERLNIIRTRPEWKQFMHRDYDLNTRYFREIPLRDQPEPAS